ncbi:hypothetical protein CLV90_1925 [Maribacter spongiicola]|uniref:Uncharacterized protein n=1 Tax=Maribacter spongiicola TaxID=1206753 RepID=A0A4R7K414_9FLAO|nr:hypothetical protein CLV90_1925 [Maribacter spongiicola]
MYNFEVVEIVCFLTRICFNKKKLQFFIFIEKVRRTRFLGLWLFDNHVMVAHNKNLVESAISFKFDSAFIEI